MKCSHSQTAGRDLEKAEILRRSMKCRTFPYTVIELYGRLEEQHFPIPYFPSDEKLQVLLYKNILFFRFPLVLLYTSV